MNVGIHGIAFYVPNIYLNIAELAKARNIEAAKLQKGLGLLQMAFPDTQEDTATMAANALLKLFEDHQINPHDIDRIYLGTESALDASKPTATYAVGMVEKVLAKEFGNRCFKHLDVVDMTFACIGAVDVLDNCLDFVRAHPNKKAIVISSDYAKYQLNSGGEYTQGAGAVAMMVQANPDIIAFDKHMGIGFESVFDFFKPRRKYDKSILANPEKSSADEVEIFLDEPVFEGHYSNQCYQDRIREAYLHLKTQLGINKPLFNDWQNLVFHLPYAFHGKRIFAEIFAMEKKMDTSDLRAITKTEEYKTFVNDKIEITQRASSAIGNMYSASIFMAMLSALETSLLENIELKGKKFGFFAYGSGSKAKVFEGTIQPNWKKKITPLNLFKTLQNRKEITFADYEKLHKKQLSDPINQEYKGFALEKIETETPHLIGARYYQFL